MNQVPLFLILNRQAKVITRKVGDLPSSFWDLCIPDSCYSTGDIGVGNDEG